MKYTILIYENENDFAARTDPARQAEYWGAYSAYSEALSKAGVMAGGAGLQTPSTGASLRLEGGKARVQDGPFLNVREQLGGFYVIDVPSMESALEWAARCPGANAAGVEVRPHLDTM